MNTRRIWSSGNSMLVLLGLVGCGTPSFGSGGEGSGSSADGESDGGGDEDDDDDDADPPRAGSGGEAGGDGGESGEEPDDGEDDTDGPEPTDDDDDDGPVTDCSCTPPQAFRNLWVPNPDAGTLSKIDADSLVTTAVYTTSASGDGEPVTASVSIDGRAVVVGNRNGGVTKIWTDSALCDPLQNTIAGVQTSTGSAMPWGADECVAWSIDIVLGDQLPVAWGPGERNHVTCEYEHQVVWTAGCHQAVGTEASGDSTVLRIDGDTGHVIDGLALSEFPCASAPVTIGAVDRDGSFWVASTTPGHARMAEISAEGTLVQLLEPPVVPAGITIDTDGYVWLSSRLGSGSATAARYDADAFHWDLAQNQVVRGESAIAQGPDGRLWVAYEDHGNVDLPGGTTIDPVQLHVGGPVQYVCGGGACTAMTIDFHGRVWTFSERDGRIYRYDPGANQLSMMSHDDIPALASDMTGLALQNAACDGI